MNRRSMLAVAMSVVLCAGAASAGSLMDKYDNAVNKMNQVDSKVQEARTAPATAKAAQQQALTDQKAQALAPIQKDLDAKNAEIKALNKSHITATEKNLRLKRANNELNSLQNKYDTTAKYYDKQIDALK